MADRYLERAQKWLVQMSEGPAATNLASDLGDLLREVAEDVNGEYYADVMLSARRDGFREGWRAGAEKCGADGRQRILRDPSIPEPVSAVIESRCRRIAENPELPEEDKSE